MAYDEGLAEELRIALGHIPGVTEKKMFGGLCFLHDGNMLCGVHSGGGMFRVGKENEAAAMALDGVREMTFTGRKMGGMVDVEDAVIADDDRRGRLIALAMDFVGALPPK